MPSPTTARGLLGNFLRGTDLPTTDQHASPLPVRLTTSLSLWAISAVGVGEMGALGGVGGYRSLRNGGGGGGVAGGRNREGDGATRDATGAEKSTTAETTTTEERTRGRRSGREHNQVSSYGAGGEYHKEGPGREESADESAEWSGADSEGLVTEEEADTSVGAWGGSKTRTVMVWDTQERGA